MHQALEGLDFCYVYIDDVLIAATNLGEHLRHLRIIFVHFVKFGIVINCDKCVLDQSEIRFLTHLVFENGIRPLPEKVQTILESPLPKTVSELRRYLRMLN